MTRSKAGNRRKDLDPSKALYSDAIQEARRLRRRHRALYNADLNGFRAEVKKAHSRVFRAKPGPKTDARIVAAARERANAAAWEDLYSKFVDGYQGMSEFTRALAEDSFRRRVNAYRRAQRRRAKKTASRKCE